MQRGSPTASGAAYVPGAEQEFREGVLRALEYADVLGAGVVHAMAGIKPADADADAAFATYASNISWAAEAGARDGCAPGAGGDQQARSAGYGLASMETAATVAQ